MAKPWRVGDRARLGPNAPRDLRASFGLRTGVVTVVLHDTLTVRFDDLANVIGWRWEFRRVDSAVPPAGPDVDGQQGCGVCGHVAIDRYDMLAHYLDRHRIRLDR